MIARKRRRLRTPKPAKPGQIKVEWGKSDPWNSTEDVTYLYGAYGAYKCHTSTLMQFFENLPVWEHKNMRQYLIDEGFDITTLRFSISQIEPLGRDGQPPPED